MSKQFTKLGCVAGALAVAGCLLVGCNRKPPAQTSGSQPQGGASATTAPIGAAGSGTVAAAPQPAEVDAQDAPDAPRAIPKSHELRGWVKSEPVRMLPIRDLASVVLDSTCRAVLSTFQLERAARCAYQRDGTTAVVLFIEAGKPEDAFGVFSIMTAQPGTLQTDGMIRAVEVGEGATVASGWQGRVFARVHCTGGAGKSPIAAECESLLTSILFNVPSAEAPWLLRALQNEKDKKAKLWVVRSTAALAAARQPVFGQVDPAVLDARLGLKGDALLAVAAVQQAPGEPSNLVWLAQYRQAAEAQSAWERYQQALVSAAVGLDANTIVADKPQGPYLAGSWTADQESIQRLLPKLETILPG